MQLPLRLFISRPTTVDGKNVLVGKSSRRRRRRSLEPDEPVVSCHVPWTNSGGESGHASKPLGPLALGALSPWGHLGLLGH